MAAALAWHHGCIRTPLPGYSRVDELSRPPRKLWELWPDHVTYWHEPFDRYKDIDVFSRSEIDLARQPGRVMVHTQTARLHLDWLGKRDFSPGCHQFLIRTEDGRDSRKYLPQQAYRTRV